MCLCSSVYFFFSFVNSRLTIAPIIHRHGGIRGKTWGSPAFIDPMYLGNPMQPQDKMGSFASRRDSKWLGVVC
ncbi:hypothetical protein E2C01_067450 [Portunus trituberculatus]|uniref:Cdc42 binding domain-containing protein n=1 Tax=Portunus trituberculatus TaxID=210409 RepID=A0A5B7HP55_PORTR|nr:hypothetical protein [Portunus trituberculatus]